MVDANVVEVYVLKEQRNFYIGENSLQYDKETNCNELVYCETLTNGYDTYPTKKQALNVLKILEDLGRKIKYSNMFHVEKINLIATMKKENNRKIKRIPFIHEKI